LYSFWIILFINFIIFEIINFAKERFKYSAIQNLLKNNKFQEVIKMMKNIILTICLLFAISFAAAQDMQMGSPKMHWPQPPDPNGWDVLVTEPIILADDWNCTETGVVNDIHIFGSWQEDDVGEIYDIKVAIYNDTPVGQIDNPYSMPAQKLWEGKFYPNDGHLILSPYEYQFGEQGFIEDPFFLGPRSKDDHNGMQVIDIINLDGFEQQEGNIYWLVVQVNASGGALFGWKTTNSSYHFNDYAVFANGIFDNHGPWMDLMDPNIQEPLDLSFVITSDEENQYEEVPELTSTSVVVLIAVIMLGVFLMLNKKRV